MEMKESFWVTCPVCGSKTKTKVYEDTILLKFPLFCPVCKNITTIDIIKLNMSLSKEPDV